MNVQSSFVTWPLYRLQVPGAPLDVAIAQTVAVGSTNVMMAGGCEPFCSWNSELTVDDIELAIEMVSRGLEHQRTLCTLKRPA